MSNKKRAGSKLKLDEMLRAGASGKRPAIDIDKAVSSTSHRLIKEAITFIKQTTSLGNSDQFRNSGFSILEPQSESLAMRRIAKLMMAKKIPQNAMKSSVRAIGAKKKISSGKKKRKKKPGEKFHTSMIMK